jgi:hypothetical protein
MRYYIVFVHDDIDPEVRGPYMSEELRDDVALALRKEFGKDHGIYPLNIDGPGKPSIEAYSGKFFMSLPEECW